MRLSPWKITAIVLSSIVGFLILLFAGYFIYVICQYNRIPDNTVIETENNTELVMDVGTEYNAVTYNIGFGAYDQEFDFFMDYGKYKDEYSGKDIKGTRGKAISKEHVVNNTNGSIESLSHNKLGAEVDFMLFQEVDTDASRSYHVNQYEAIKDYYTDAYKMASIYVSNFHTAYLAYPLHDHHGKSNAGIATFSKYKMADNIRRSYPISTGFSKFFDLDRCFVITRIPVNGDKEFVLINSHMSAYDEGGVYRQAQLKMLNDILTAEADKGNYVVVGGDFNHDIANSKSVYPSHEIIPDESVNGWLYQLFDGVNVVNAEDKTHSDLAEGYTFATTLYGADGKTLVPTCRCAEMPYARDDNGIVKNYQAVLDGFIVSSNIEVVKVANIDTDFKYSDHNPVQLSFKLK